ncbi:MAG TPA: hypothetical protein VF647_22725 [Longimicrobium sp.]|jgi:hypothetical protein
MGLFEAVVEGVAERAQRKDVSRWEKARDMLDLRAFLHSQGRQHSLRQLSELTRVARATISEQLLVAETLTPEVLTRSGVSPMAIARTPHTTLLRIARLPAPLRAAALRETVGSEEGEDELTSAGGRISIDARHRRRAQLFERLHDEGGFHVSVVEPLREVPVRQAKAYLDHMLPALASLTETLLGNQRSYYIGVTGNGGLFVYLSPSDARALS